MATELTKKEKGFVKDFIDTGSGTKAALNNYDTEDENVAASIASQNLRKLKIQNAIHEAIPDELLAEKHLALLNKIDDKGEIDVVAVKAGLDMGYKIKGSYAPEKKDITTGGEKLPSTDLDTLAEKMATKLKEKKI